MVLSHCGIDCWNESMELSDVVDYIYLAKSAALRTSISTAYIAFVTKMQKRQTR